MSFKVEHRIGVQAPAQVVWDLIADIPGWPAWNPLYPQAAGVIRKGQRLSLSVALPDQPVEAISPTVLDWTPEDQLHLRTAYAKGLVTTVRYLEIDVMGPQSCVFSNGELFIGLVGGFVGKRMKKPLKQGFTLMGEALRDQAETLWRQQGGAPTSEA